MTYASIKDGVVEEYPLLPDQIKALFPDTSFSEAFQPPEGYVLVKRAAQPATDYTKNVAEGEPALVEGVWTQTWVVVDATEEEVQDRIKAIASRIRGQRGRLLSETDWVVSRAFETGTAVPANYATYRQALRDITDQQGFPHSISWPILSTD